MTIAEKDGASILCVIMGGETDGYNNNYTYILASRLIDWAFENYGYIDVFSTSDAICNIPVALAMDTDSVVAVPSRKVSYYLPVSVKVSPAPGENPDADITYTYRLTEASLDAPVESGKAVGFLSVFYKGELIDSVVLVAGKSVDQSRLLYIFERAYMKRKGYTLICPRQGISVSRRLPGNCRNTCIRCPIGRPIPFQ